LSWISRFTARTGSVLAAVAFAAALAGRADAASTYLFAGKPLPISHLVTVGGKPAIAVTDAGLRDLLRDVGAALTWNSGDRYVLFTTAEPQIVSFAVGDTRYDIGPRSAQAAFAPFEQNGTVYVPLNELLGALSLALKPEGGTTIVQPQLTAIDVQGSPSGLRVIARAGIALHPRLVSESSSRVVYAFDGVGTTLQRVRSINSGGVRDIEVAQGGTARDPTTQLTLALSPGTSLAAPSSDDGLDFVLALGSAGNVPAVAPSSATIAQSQPTPVASDEPSAEPTATYDTQTVESTTSSATVTAVTETTNGGDYTIAIAASGDATYDWEHTRAPDNRFWIDIDGKLQMPPRNDPGGGAVSQVRINQQNADTVRVALSLTGYKLIDVATTPTGVQIVVHATDAGADVARTGTGAIGNAVAAAVAAASPSPSPGPWKFAPHSSYVPTNPRLIVIDPGHGGSDPGTVHGGQREADLTLDMAKRLRDVLVARGWEVKMTRTTDVDVYQPYDSAHVELQARDDVANLQGARLFISVHVNGYQNSGPNGTTTYYSKPEDVALAKDVQHDLTAVLGTTDDGIVKSLLYVTLHAKMPSVLVETAFLTNPDDFAKLTSPAWRQKVAGAIADGVRDYAGAPPAAAQTDDQ
jgi:N-acetylmuramoyl-L-alanine amidase